MSEVTNALYTQISRLEETDEIKKVLPDFNLPYFEDVMEGIISRLQSDLEELDRLFKEIHDEEVKQYIEIVKRQIEVCQNHLRHMVNDVGQEEKGETKNLIYATSNANNIFLESDIRSIEPEFYDKIIKALTDLKRGVKSKDPRKSKIITNNASLDKVYERKENDIRVIYQAIDRDSILVMLVKTKKSDSDNYKAISRVKNTSSLLQAFKIAFKNPNQKAQIVAQNELIHHDIINYLEQNKRIAKKEKEEIEVLTLEPRQTVIKKQKDKDKLKELKSQDPVWYHMYVVAKIIAEEKGHINLRIGEKTANGVEIGKWVKQQKVLYHEGKLSDLKIELLENLNIAWEIVDENIRKEKIQFKASKDTTEVITQTNENVELTEQVPISKIVIIKNDFSNLNNLDYRWEINYLLAKEFYENNGHAVIPRKYKVILNGETYNLGIWISNQRNNYKSGKLSEDRIQKLEAIGMIWAVYKTSSSKQRPKISRKPKYKKAYLSDTEALISIAKELNSEQLDQLKTVINKMANNSLARDSIESVYQGLLNLGDKQDEFTLMLETDSEGLEKASRKVR